MFHLDIFILGLFVMAITMAAVILVGIYEADDPGHARPEDLSNWEKKLVDRPDVKEDQGAVE